jgi:hypothetical protein
MSTSFRERFPSWSLPQGGARKRAERRFDGRRSWESEATDTKGDRMYIGGGFIALILIILLLIWLF